MNRSSSTRRRLLILIAAAALAVAPASSRAADEVTPPAAEPMVDSPWFDVGWPKVEMPKFSWKPWRSSAPAGDAPAAPQENPVSRALDRVADASKNAATGVRNAWGSAVGKISSLGAGPGDEAVARSESPGFFSRLFGSADEPRAPASAAEYLAQERPSTTVK